MPPATRRAWLKTTPGLIRLTRFDENEASVSSLLNELHSLRIEYINNKDSKAKRDRYNKVKQETQAKFREVKDKWWCDSTRELQSAADTNNAKNFTGTLKTKAPGVYHYGGDKLAAELTRFFKELWAEGEIPPAFKAAMIIHVYKNKGDRRFCDNHRRISLHSKAGKIFARVIANRLTTCLDTTFPES